MDPIFLFILVALAIVVFVGVGYYLRMQRRKEMTAFAQLHGLTFDPGKAYGLDDRFGEFACLAKGSRRFAYNRMAGDWNGRQILAFDYHYETYSHDSKGRRRTHHHRFSAVILESPLPLKPLLIRPEGFFDKVKDFFGFDDIDFESAEFSRRFYVQADDRKWAYDVIHARAMEFLMASPQFSLQFGPAHVIAYRDRTLPVPEFALAVEVAGGLLDRVPDYVRQQQQGGPA